MEWGNVAQWVSGIATSAAVVVALYRDVFFRWLSRPKLIAEIKADYPYCVKTPHEHTMPGNVVWRGSRYWLRLRVTNTGRTRANKVEVFVSSVSVQQGNEGFKHLPRFTPMNLRWSYSAQIYADGISPHMSKLCDFAAISDPKHPELQKLRPDSVGENQTRLALQLEVLPWIVDWLVPGRYEFEIKLAAANAKAVTQKIALHLTGMWSEDETEMLNHGFVISIHPSS